MTVIESRPPLTAELSGAEFSRWYWLREELAAAARSMGLPASGDKKHLAGVIQAHLDGEPLPAPLARQALADRLPDELTLTTVIPPGQRSSQRLRAFFEQHILGFHFDGAMREFIARGGSTLDEVISYWHQSRSAQRRPIDDQFEFNRFARAWHDANPAGSREHMMRAWMLHRSLPSDARPPVGGA